jgi:hypothetical protein
MNERQTSDSNTHPATQTLVAARKGRPSAWFTLSAGALVRGQAKARITEAAWRAGLDVRVEEAKSLLGSVYRFTVTGTSDDIRRFLTVLRKWEAINYGA